MLSAVRATFKCLFNGFSNQFQPVLFFCSPIDSDAAADEDKRQLVLKAAHSLMKGVRSMMSRDKTLTITPKKASSKSLSSVGLVRNQKPTWQLLSQ